MEVPCEFIHDSHTYKCHVENVDFTNQEIANFHGAHPKNFTNNKVTVICFDSCIMTNFPRNLKKFFPRLTVIQISSCGIKKITKNDLKGYPDLIYLGIIDNEITHLPGDLFENNQKLNYIDFSQNKIVTIGSSILSPLKYVFGVIFRDNKNIDHHYCEEDDENNVESLEELIQIIKINCRPLETLKIIAAEKMMENMTMENVKEIFFYAERFGLETMKRKSFLFLQKNVYLWLEEKHYRNTEKLMKTMVKDGNFQV